jgi:hypothetical protein
MSSDNLHPVELLSQSRLATLNWLVHAATNNKPCKHSIFPVIYIQRHCFLLSVSTVKHNKREASVELKNNVINFNVFKLGKLCSVGLIANAGIGLIKYLQFRDGVKNVYVYLYTSRPEIQCYKCPHECLNGGPSGMQVYLFCMSFCTSSAI